jgi:ABC-2 type transport system ATP-binding protein
MTALGVRGLVKRFGPVTAIAGIDLEVQPGEVVGLLGPNGAGKTTTLHAVLGLVTPNAGEIRLFGRDISRHRTEVLSRVNFAAGYINLPGALTVEENLLTFARMYALAKPRARVAEVIELLDLAEMRHRRLRLLSSGQQTRVQLGKALLNEPELLVLDEPTASLDPDIGDRVRQLLLGWARAAGSAMLITSHNMLEIERMCDRIAFMQAGRIVATGSASELATAYGVGDLEEVFLRVART